MVSTSAIGYQGVKRTKIRDLYIGSGRSRFILTLRAYFDETGDSPDPGCKAVGIVGCAADIDAWDHFEPEWRLALAEFGVRPEVGYHGVDVEHRRKAFEGWCLEKVRTFRSVLLDVMERHVAWYVGCMVELSMYRAAPHSADTVDPYFTGYQAAVDETARLGSLFLPAGERIQIYVAKKAKGS